MLRKSEMGARIGANLKTKPKRYGLEKDYS